MSEHPWSTCCVRDCQRRSRKFPEGVEWICGRCYRRSPKVYRDRRANLGRKLARTRDPQRRWRLQWLRGRCIDMMIKALNAEPEGDEMTPAMREQLRKDGLL